MNTIPRRLAAWLVGGALAVATLIVTASSLSAAPIAPVQSTRQTGEIQTAANDYRICCKRGNRDWWSSQRDCRRNGGYVAANRQCRNDNSNWHQNNVGNQRICCKRGRADWWSSRRECGRSGGYVAADRQCRNDRSNFIPRPYYRR